MDAMQILVIVLAVFLGLFLITAIILVVLLIKVTTQIKKVTATAQTAAENLNSFATNAARFSSPLSIGKLIFNRIKKRK